MQAEKGLEQSEGSMGSVKAMAVSQQSDESAFLPVV